MPDPRAARRARQPRHVPELGLLLVFLLACVGCSLGPTSVSSASTPRPASTDGVAGQGDPAPARELHRSRITVVMNGDLLLHEGLWASARLDAARTGRGPMDFRPLFGHMRPFIESADLAICHLETPLAPAEGPYSGYPLFSVPPQVVPALRWAGFDACTTASNHSVDRGFEGIERTARALDDAGVARTGANVTRQESRRARFILVKGVEVALLSATYGLNGLPLPRGRSWAVNLIDTDRLVRQARDARRAGAELVLVALHWGDEYVNEPSRYQRAVARTLASSGQFDLIYGHHAHVAQPYDRLAGTWVLYGQGNAVAQQSTAVDGLYDGNAARVTFEAQPGGRFGVARVEYLPTRVTHYSPGRPMRYLNVPRALTQARFGDLRGDLEGTLARVRAVIGARGAFRRGVTPAAPRPSLSR